MQNKVFSSNKILNLGGRLVQLDTPKIMGILNVTPDSFFDGGKYTDEKSILRHVEKMQNDGADFIDVGGYSSRPGATDFELREELSRTIPAIRSIIRHFPSAIVSVDTFRAEVARQAIEEGAMLVNDISGGDQDQGMFDLIGHHRVPYILMHMRGNPQTMKTLAQYKHVTKEVVHELSMKLDRLRQLGIADVLVDPGFGFAKTVEQNFELLKHLDHLKILGKLLVVGLSRKSMIWRTLDTSAENALNGTTVLNTIALIKGADILRIHDVKEAAEAIKLTNFVK